MKTTIPRYLLLITCYLLFIFGCASTNNLRECRDRISKLEKVLLSLSQQTRELQTSLDKSTKMLEHMRFEMEVIRKEILALTSGEPQEPPKDQVARLIEEMKDEKANLERIGSQLSFFGLAGVNALIEVLPNPDLVFRRRVEKALAMMPAKETAPVLIISLRNRHIRASAARILGNLKEPSAMAALAQHLKDEDDDFCFEIAQALMKLKDKRGIPVLIENLEHTDAAKRTLAFNVLAKVTGLTFNYKHYEPEKERAVAVKKWEKWWLEYGKDFKFKK